MATDLATAAIDPTDPTSDTMTVRLAVDSATDLIAIGLDRAAADALFDLLDGVDTTDLVDGDGFDANTAAGISALVHTLRPMLRNHLLGY